MSHAPELTPSPLLDPASYPVSSSVSTPARGPIAPCRLLRAHLLHIALTAAQGVICKNHRKNKSSFLSGTSPLSFRALRKTWSGFLRKVRMPATLQLGSVYCTARMEILPKKDVTGLL